MKIINLLFTLFLLTTFMPMNSTASSYIDVKCEKKNIEEMQTQKFIDNMDGTIINIETQLIWQKCSLGQEYNKEKNNCLGYPALYSWEQANKSFSYENWRLPTITELFSIVSYNCFQPTINSLAFPNSCSGFYWSTTKYGQQTKAYGVFFLYGEIALSEMKFKRNVRLVKDIL